MPLPPSTISRQPLQTRSIGVQFYAREDGLWDLEAEPIDTKAYDFPTQNGDIFKAGRPIHHMHLRITINGDFEIMAAQAVYDASPYGKHCVAIESAYADLFGMNLLKEFRRQVKERFGHVAGCTHMTELSQVLPTTAIQTMVNRQRREINPEKRPFQLDGCHALSTSGHVVLEHYPKWYTANNAEVSAS